MEGRSLASLVAVFGLAVALLPLTGCVGLKDALSDEVPLVKRTIATERAQFTPGGAGPPTIPPGPQPGAEHRTFPFDVPPNARDLNVTIVVTFAAPPPGPVPAGNLRLELVAPADTSDEVTITGNTVHTWLKPTPQSGTWSLVMEATGSVTLDISISAMVPRPPS